MKKKLSFLAYLILFLIIFTGCQKENSESELLPVDQKATLDNLKAFYNSETSIPSKNKYSNTFTPNRGEPQWEKIMYSFEKGKYILPVEVNKRKVNEKFSVTKYLVITGEKNKMSGSFYYLVRKNNSQETTDLNAVFRAIEVISGDKLTATASLSFTANFTFTCLWGSDAGSYSTNNTSVFAAD